MFLKHQNLNTISYGISYSVMLICTSALCRGSRGSSRRARGGSEHGGLARRWPVGSLACQEVFMAPRQAGWGGPGSESELSQRPVTSLTPLLLAPTRREHHRAGSITA